MESIPEKRDYGVQTDLSLLSTQNISILDRSGSDPNNGSGPPKLDPSQKSEPTLGEKKWEGIDGNQYAISTHGVNEHGDHPALSQVGERQNKQ
jgi:hypothetical protein